MLSQGNFILVSPGRSPDAECVREARADRFGTIELEPLLWQAPPIEGARLILARDLGPAMNAAVRASLPGRTPYVYATTGPGGRARLLPYAEGMRLLWDGGADDAAPAR